VKTISIIAISVAVSFALFSNVLTTNPAFALSCAGPTWDEEFDRVDVVFIGKVTEKEYDLASEVATSTLQVEEIFKGSLNDIAKIKSDEHFFGINLLEGWRYLIFADDNGDYFSVNLCTRSGIFPPIPSSDKNIEDSAKHNMMMLEIVLMDQKPSPLKQVKQGVWLSDIICNSDLVLIGKIDGTPVCVKQDSIAKLVERGWANPYYAPDASSIQSFEECAAAGNPVMESYPRQCRTADGKHFVEIIPGKEQCEIAGGLWGIWGNRSPATASCNPSTSDVGKECTDSSQCQSFCQANEGAEINSEEAGKCYGYELAICMQEVRNSVVDPEWCQ